MLTPAQQAAAHRVCGGPSSVFLCAASSPVCSPKNRDACCRTWPLLLLSSCRLLLLWVREARRGAPPEPIPATGRHADHASCESHSCIPPAQLSASVISRPLWSGACPAECKLGLSDVKQIEHGRVGMCSSISTRSQKNRGTIKRYIRAFWGSRWGATFSQATDPRQPRLCQASFGVGSVAEQVTIL